MILDGQNLLMFSQIQQQPSDEVAKTSATFQSVFQRESLRLLIKNQGLV